MLMRILNKTGFITTSKKVVIYRDGMPFYSKSRSGYNLTFNLPAGTYDVKEGELKKLSEPLHYKKIVLPPPNKISYFSGNVTISFIDNPNKCSIDLSDRKVTRIFFDNSYKNFPRFVTTWIVGHELAHNLYKGQGQTSEKNCDNYSANMMLRLGYNPSQIDAAIDMAISNGFLASKRKKVVYENLLKLKNRNGNRSKYGR